ncbi:hypothetical protein BI335_08805 [Enemella evansiae]|uniref:CgeB family protein n=1 Tax=Enemella evansiae TaxID=2016499 RepID=UPI000B9741F8|nr:glycosyltransferase [Enemella evansiae]OYO16858.1 hypothetical protein BI335_08805 [Enemella evansiae]
MRIAVVGPLGKDSFADNVIDQLAQDGHQVRPLGPARPPLGVRKVDALFSVVSDHHLPLDARRQAPMRKEIAAFRPEVLITVDRRLHASTIAAAKATGARTALWFPDAVGTMGLHDMFTNGYDRIFLKNPVLTNWLQQVQGLPVRLLPEAGNPRRHTSDLPYGTRPVVVLAGNVHPTRAALLQRMVDAGLPVEVYGSGIPSWLNFPDLSKAHTGKYLTWADKGDAFRSARIVLNNLHPTEFAGTNCRLFEGTMSGGLVMTEHRPGLEEQFVPDEEVATFTTFDELVDKCRWLLDDPDHGRPIADAGRQRSLTDHTYAVRLGALLDELTG